MIMKDFDKWFESLHSSTNLAYVASVCGTPIGHDTYEEAIKNNP